MTLPWTSEPSASTTAAQVQDAFWYFASQRLDMFLRRTLGDLTPPADPILRTYRFTNTYRVCDRVSQFLVSNVQHGYDQNSDELVFRTLLFKFFNKIATWTFLAADGVPSINNFDADRCAEALSQHAAAGNKIYSAAYIVPPVVACPRPKHLGHLRLLSTMLEDDLPAKVRASGELEELYWLLRGYSGLGDFLAFQLAVDLTYSSAVPFDDGAFVVAGPGAVDGVSKCFPEASRRGVTAVIQECCDTQEEQFAARGIRFDGLFGRRLQPIDVQNLFCELSKYSRVAFPDVAGVAGRTRIKQRYVPAGPLPPPFFPPKWGLRPPLASGGVKGQGSSRHVRRDDAAPMFPELMEDPVAGQKRRLPLRA